ncbi:ABC transporter permease subunit, partial [Microbacterium aurum]
TETVFARPGIGQLTAQAVANRDTPVLLAVVVISTVAFVAINLIVDLLYPVLDARLRTPRAAKAVRADPIGVPA